MSGSSENLGYFDYLYKLGEGILEKAVDAIHDHAPTVVSDLLKSMGIEDVRKELEFNTEVLEIVIDNFLDNHKDDINYNEIRYYLGLLLIKHFESKERVASEDPEIIAAMDYDFVQKKLVEFAKAYNNSQNGPAGNGAKVIFLELLSQRDDFNPNDYKKKVAFDKPKIQQYIKDNLSLTPKELMKMKVRHAWNTPLKMLRGLDNIFSMALKKTLILIVDVSFKYAPDHTTGYIIKKASKDKLGAQAGGFAHALVQGGVNLGESTGLMPDARKQLNARIKEETHNVINKLDARPSMLAINTARKSKEQAKQLGIKAKEFKKIVKKKAKKTVDDGIIRKLKKPKY